VFTIRNVVAVGALLLLAASSAVAQQHEQHGKPQGAEQGGMQGAMMENMEEHMGGVGGIHAYQPSRLLEHKEHLALSAAQVTKLEGLAATAPALEAGEMGRHHASLAHFTVAADARALLTAEQRAMVEEMIGHDHDGGGQQHQH
jgi:hypothetical protein